VGGITLAWLIGTGIISWRSVKKNRRPPMPGELLGASGFFVLLALLAEYQPARSAATLMAFGIDVAAYLEAPLVTVPNTGATVNNAKSGPQNAGSAPTPTGA
jgi:uncharacterized YccA/Bax inhibitor family protein